MSKNPYDCGNFPGKFKVDYVGQDDGWYVLRLHMAGQKALDGLMFENEITNHMMMNAYGEWHMGSGFGIDANLPAPKLARHANGDRFILIETFADLIGFESNFVVDGISPAKLAA